MSPRAELLMESHASVRDAVRHAYLMARVEGKAWEAVAYEVKFLETSYSKMWASRLAAVAKSVAAREDYPLSPCWRKGRRLP